MHEYTVELRISGVELIPSAITADLRLEPSSLRDAGERRGEGRVWEKALWGYNGFPANARTSWASLEEGLTFLLDTLEPLRPQIDKYKQKYDFVWWCGHFQSSFDGGPALSSKLMKRLADFGVDLYVDTHFVQPDPAVDER